MMKRITSFSDYFLLKAASQYVYEMSSFYVYKDPILTVQMNLQRDFLNRYAIERCENKAFKRDGVTIDVRYLLVKDVKTDEYALIFQGSEGEITSMFSGEDCDWSNNLSSIAQLELPNFDVAKSEFEYLKYKKGYNITALSGNSLGGGYALYISDAYADVRAIGLNAAPRSFSSRYKKNHYATLVLTSSDVLSRSLSLDLSRLSGENTVKFQSQRNLEDRLTDAYGVKPYSIKRSIPFSSGENISIGHVGAMRNYRKILLQIYNKNFLYYNARIITKHKEWRSFSKYLLQTAYRELEQGDYRAFTEDYIYPSLTNASKGIVNSYMYFPQVEDFGSFDLVTMNLLDKRGQKFFDDNYKIEDTFEFMNNFSALNESFRRTKSFFINNSMYEIQSTREDEGFGFTKKNFIEKTLKVTFDWDWVFAKMFLDMPMSVKLSTREFLEQNVTFVYRLNGKLSDQYELGRQFSDDVIFVYTQELLEAFVRLASLNQSIYEMNQTIAANVELMLIEGKDQLFKSNGPYETMNDAKHFNVSDLIHLNEHVISEHFNAAKSALTETKQFAEESVIDISNTMIKILETVHERLKIEKQKDDNPRVQKLFHQTEELLRNVDLKSFLLMALNHYQDDIVAYLLRDSVAITVQYNIVQMIEVNEKQLNQYKNLQIYLKECLTKHQYDYITKDIKIVINHIEVENKQLKNILKVT